MPDTDSQGGARWSWKRIKQALGGGTQPAGSATQGAAARYQQGLAAEQAQRYDEAEAQFRAAVDSQPGEAQYHYALAAVLRRLGRLAEAASAYRAALARAPDDAGIRVDLGLALKDQRRLEEAQAELERARELAPDLMPARLNLGVVYHQLGLLERAIAELRAAHELAPDHAGVHSNLLFVLNYSARHGAEEVFAEHRRFGARHVQPVASPAPDPAWPRRLRVGYVSPDFRSHVVSSFMLPVFAKHDRARFEVYGYYSYAQADTVTAAMRDLADNWLDCAHYGDAELADQIRADRIDILVDLAGHTVHHRLRTFALRPAPLQLTYLGYPNTTGLSAIDARITDAKADPPGTADRLNTERLARLPRTFLCYRPGPDLEVGAPPAAAAGSVTFGCFNNFQKLSEPFFDVAAQLLAAVPGSRLLLKAQTLETPAVAQRVRERFAAAGIDGSRLELLGWEPSPEGHLAAYRRVDVALDSFPYNGTTTTCEALWMGVPVVALAGDRHAGRVGASLLETVGLQELLARDSDEYLDIARRLAADLPRLAALRAGMRERVRASPLRDEAGFVRELEDCYARLWQEKLEAAAAPPPTMEALTALWNRCHDAGEGAEFVDAAGRALAAGPGSAQLHFMLGCTMEDLARPQDAMSAYRKALERDPAFAKAANNLGCVQEALGDLDGAAASYDQALRAEPKLANALYNRANLARARGDLDAAEAGFAQALALEPQRAEWLGALADVRLLRWRLDEAEAGHRAGLALAPASPQAHFGLGNVLMLLGRVQEAEACFRRAIDLHPDFVEAHSNLLLCLHYRRGAEGPALFDEHLGWATCHAGGLEARGGHPAIDRAPGRRLNVGYVSPNFHRHSVASFLEPLLAAHDRDSVRVFCYSGVQQPDEVTARLRGMADEWRDLRGMDANAAARLIREDRIDVLVDLAGHTGGGRPLLFARKPAPVQVAWLGYPNTTGLAQMDWRLTDEVADPPGESDRIHSEKLVRLADGFLCFQPEAGSPEPGEPPSAASGSVTFGCFNNLAKVTPEMVALWSRLLGAVPGSRLMMKAHALGSASARKRLQEEFAAGGVVAGRIVLLGPEDSAAGHLGRYREVDIALDTYPYNGTTTTCEALWMGVPVVTLAGPTHVTRVGASLLKRVGLDDLVAASPDAYVARASALANDAARLRALRKDLRARLQASPLMDRARLARSVESAYRAAWNAWLDATAAKSPAPAAPVGEPLRLHVGGKQVKDGWKILNVQPGPDVDYVGNCTELGQFADGAVQEIYASHVLEHLGYKSALPRTLSEFHRVLRVDGRLMISVPDFEILCRMFLDPRASLMERFSVMRMAFGGQMDEHDFHYVGLSYEILSRYLFNAGFSRVERVKSFGLFDDSSLIEHRGEAISLNVAAYK
ncbi:MAG TPA: tetratricopeptide repeat protein [Burkholderiales bacterium]|nr:tetratricopeptide repeat protein [Burkholderiales bacterium]